MKTICSTTELAEVLGLTARRVQQLAKEGILQPEGRGKFRLDNAVQSYIKFLGHSPAATASGEKIDLKVERAKLTKAKRELAEIELSTARAEVHHSEDVRRVMGGMLGAFRSRILAIPTKLAPRLVAQTDLAVIQDIVKKQLYEALSELSEYDPAAFRRKESEPDEN